MRNGDAVFDNYIFHHIFYKDIKRVFIYKKAERLARALYPIAPPFGESVSLRTKAEAIAVALTETASLPATRFADPLSRELLALSGVLSMAQVGGLLSPVNADLIAAETRSLLADISSYEEPRLMLDDSPGLTKLAKHVPSPFSRGRAPRATLPPAGSQGHTSTRQANILSFIKEKGSVSVKDISLIIRGVSEKTIQRELQGLIDAGRVVKRGERRWSTYSLVSGPS